MTAAKKNAARVNKRKLSPDERAARRDARLDAARKARKEKRDAAWLDAQGRMSDLEQRVRAAGPNCSHDFAKAAHAKRRGDQRGDPQTAPSLPDRQRRAARQRAHSLADRGLRMSATNRGAERRADDFYATPAWATRAILPALLPSRGRILEPAAGDGAIIDQLIAFGVPSEEIDAFEIDRGRAEASGAICADFLDQQPTALYGVVVTNPPYSLAFEFAKHGVKFLRPGGVLALLTRINWLASQKRAPWLRENTPSVHVLPKRPSFTGKGTDATDYAWMTWRQGRITGDRISENHPYVRVLEVSL